MILKDCHPFRIFGRLNITKVKKLSPRYKDSKGHLSCLNKQIETRLYYASREIKLVPSPQEKLFTNGFYIFIARSSSKRNLHNGRLSNALHAQVNKGSTICDSPKDFPIWSWMVCILHCSMNNVDKLLILFTERWNQNITIILGYM